MELDQLKVIVTGGASGLGEHFAKQLLAAGAQVAVGDVNEDGLAALPEGTWAELIDGEIYVTPSPSEPHQRAVIRLIVLLEASARENRSRIPVEDPESGRFLGFVHILDLVFSPDTPPADLFREAPEFRGDVTVQEVLHSLRRRRQTIGFVTAEDGATRGIVTMKDLVEEVSGELPAF